MAAPDPVRPPHRPRCASTGRPPSARPVVVVVDGPPRRPARTERAPVVVDPYRARPAPAAPPQLRHPVAVAAGGARGDEEYLGVGGRDPVGEGDRRDRLARVVARHGPGHGPLPVEIHVERPWCERPTAPGTHPVHPTVGRRPSLDHPDPQRLQHHGPLVPALEGDPHLGLTRVHRAERRRPALRVGLGRGRRDGGRGPGDEIGVPAAVLPDVIVTGPGERGSGRRRHGRPPLVPLRQGPGQGERQHGDEPARRERPAPAAGGGRCTGVRGRVPVAAYGRG
ncbi:hypothetical protein GA0115244_11561, partial [Streptomyces sp. DvalAA-19]